MEDAGPESSRGPCHVPRERCVQPRAGKHVITRTLNNPPRVNLCLPPSFSQARGGFHLSLASSPPSLRPGLVIPPATCTVAGRLRCETRRPPQGEGSFESDGRAFKNVSVCNCRLSNVCEHEREIDVSATTLNDETLLSRLRAASRTAKIPPAFERTRECDIARKASRTRSANIERRSRGGTNQEAMRRKRLSPGINVDGRYRSRYSRRSREMKLSHARSRGRFECVDTARVFLRSRKRTSHVTNYRRLRRTFVFRRAADPRISINDRDICHVTRASR